MIWEEALLDLEGTVYYCKCDYCKKYPAMVVYKDYGATEYNYAGPLCKDCWINEINKAFDGLDKRLENEDWGSSPETRGER